MADRSYYACACRLFIEASYVIKREVFDGISPDLLQSNLEDPQNRAILEGLKESQIISQEQWQQLYPPADSRKFDPIFIWLLLPNICNLKTPDGGWRNKEPLPVHMSREDDIVRIGIYGNKLHERSGNQLLSEPEFNKYWEEIQGTLVGLGGLHYEEKIKKLKNDSKTMGQKREKYCIDYLEKWNKSYGSLMKELEAAENRKIHEDCECKVAEASKRKQDEENRREYLEMKNKIEQMEKDKVVSQEEVARINNEISKAQLQKERDNKPAGKEITKLEKQIKQLKKDKAESQNEVERKTDALNVQLYKLTLQNTKILNELDETTTNMRSEIQGLNKNNTGMQDQIHNLIQMTNEQGRTLGKYKSDQAKLHLGQMCLKLEISIFKKVLPQGHYDPKINKEYKLRDIEKIIDSLPTDGLKEEASKKWQELKTKLKWDQQNRYEQNQNLLALIMSSRNDTGHPNIEEPELRQHAEYMAERGWPIETVRELIDSWVILTVG